jgi:hypothetical protein
MVRTGKRGVGFVVELNERDKEALIHFKRIKTEYWYRFSELEPAR